MAAEREIVGGRKWEPGQFLDPTTVCIEMLLLTSRYSTGSLVQLTVQEVQALSLFTPVLRVVHRCNISTAGYAHSYAACNDCADRSP
jgi:hypothetical protein